MDNSARLEALGFKEQLALAQLVALAQRVLGLQEQLESHYLRKLIFILDQLLGQNQQAQSKL
jgi:hypothetical protein